MRLRSARSQVRFGQAHVAVHTSPERVGENRAADRVTTIRRAGVSSSRHLTSRRSTERQQGVWSTGDFGRFGALLVLHGELLAESVDIHPGERVLDVGGGTRYRLAGRGAALRRRHLHRLRAEGAPRTGRATRGNGGPAVRDPGRRRTGPPLRGRLVQRRDLHVRCDVCSRSAARRGRARTRLPRRRAHRHGQLGTRGR